MIALEIALMSCYSSMITKAENFDIYKKLVLQFYQNVQFLPKV